MRLSDRNRLKAKLERQGRVILAIDGLQPDVGHEVLWVVRERLSGEVLLARSLLSGKEEDLANLLREVVADLPAEVKIGGLISDGQHPIRRAVRRVLPSVPHHNCASSTTCARRPRASTKPIVTPKRNSKTTLEASAGP